MERPGVDADVEIVGGTVEGLVIFICVGVNEPLDDDDDESKVERDLGGNVGGTPRDLVSPSRSLVCLESIIELSWEGVSCTLLGGTTGGIGNNDDDDDDDSLYLPISRLINLFKSAITASSLPSNSVMEFRQRLI